MAMKLHGALLSLVLPGLGQFGQHRPIAGHGFLWGTVASLAYLMLSERLHIPGTFPLAALGAPKELVTLAHAGTTLRHACYSEPVSPIRASNTLQRGSWCSVANPGSTFTPPMNDARSA